LSRMPSHHKPPVMSHQSALTSAPIETLTYSLLT